MERRGGHHSACAHRRPSLAGRFQRKCAPVDGNDPAAGWFNVVQGVFFTVLAACWFTSLARQVHGNRRSSGERRQQLKWLMAGSALAFGRHRASPSFAEGKALGTVVALAGFFSDATVHRRGHPRYRLFDIDRIITRTLAYAIVTGLAGGGIRGAGAAGHPAERQPPLLRTTNRGPGNLCWPTISAGFRGAGCRRSQRTGANLVAAIVDSAAVNAEYIHHGRQYGPRRPVAIHL